MAIYSSKPFEVNSAADKIVERFSDLSLLQQYVDSMPAEQREKVGDVEFTRDSIIMKTKQVGDVTLKVIELSDRKIVLAAQNSPMPLKLVVDITPLDAERSELVTSIDADIPAMLKPMVGGMFQKAADQFGTMIKNFA